MTRYVIVGMGVAGISAALTLRNLEPSAEITMVGEDPYGFYSRPGLAYYLNGEIPEKQLTIFSKKEWHNSRIRFVHGLASRLDPGKHTVTIHPASILPYDRLLLATGSRAVPLHIPGADLHGVVKLDDLSDTRSILALSRRSRSAVVVGGGIIAVELVEGLIARGLKVHFFLRGNRYWPNILDEKESRLLEHRLAEHGVVILHNTEAAEILGRRGRVSGVRTTRGETIKCDLVAVGIGVAARTDLARAAGLQVDRGVLANETLQTSDPDIFVAGDASQITDPSSGQSYIETLWHPARKKGEAAAFNMSGRRTAYQKTPAVNVLRLGGVMTTIIGAVGNGTSDEIVSMARGSSETWRQLPNTIAIESNSSGVNHVRLVIGENTLLGALVMGEQKLSLPLEEIITSKMDITSIRSKLYPGAPLGELVMDFWAGNKKDVKPS